MKEIELLGGVLIAVFSNQIAKITGLPSEFVAGIGLGLAFPVMIWALITGIKEFKNKGKWAQ